MDEAEKLVRRSLELESDLRSSRFYLGRILEARGDRAGAERLYREELETYPDNGRARFNLAQLRREEGDAAGFLAELRESTEKAPDFAPAFFFLAREELPAGRLDDALALARKGLEKDERSVLAPLGHYVLADVYTPPGTARRGRRRGREGAEDRGGAPRHARSRARRRRVRRALLGGRASSLAAAAGFWLLPREPALPAGVEGALAFVSDARRRAVALLATAAEGPRAPARRRGRGGRAPGHRARRHARRVRERGPHRRSWRWRRATCAS